MNHQPPVGVVPILRVVLTDANVLYSRVLRDYVLYAAEHRIIAVAWSREILIETTDNLMRNRPGFTRDSADRLITALTRTFPYAEIDPEPNHFARLAHLNLPDEGDRHVIAAALAAEADVICTSNTRDFPSAVVAELDLTVLTPGELICRLVSEFPVTMRAVHRTAVANLPGATDESTLAALRRAGSRQAAAAMERLLEQDKA